MATINAINNASAPFTVTSGDLVVTSGNLSTTAGSITSATTLTATLGNFIVTSGNLTLPATTATVGQILIGGVPHLHTFGGFSLFVGANSGNFTFNTSFNYYCVGVGANTLRALNGGASLEGRANTAIGYNSGYSVATAFGNTFCGYNAGYLVTGGYNVQVGVGSSTNGITSGAYNTFLGASVGENYTSSEGSNILIGYGTAGTNAESHKLRIGKATGTGDGELDAAYIAGIYGKTSGTTCSVMLVDSANKISGSGATGTAGYVLTSNGATSIPTWQAVPAAGTGLTWTEATGDITASVNKGYTINKASLLTVTLPATAAVGSTVAIAGNSSTGWSLVAASGDTIKYGNQTTSSGGSLSSTLRYDCVEVICVTADTTWVVNSSVGNLTVA